MGVHAGAHACVRVQPCACVCVRARRVSVLFCMCVCGRVFCEWVGLALRGLQLLVRIIAPCRAFAATT